MFPVGVWSQNKHLEGFTEYVNPLLKQVLPQSLGDCASATHVAPRPCVGAMPLAYIRTDIYEATARWATGLKTTELHTARFEVTPKGRYASEHSKYSGWQSWCPG